MTTAEKTLKWWNDYLEQNKTYPLLSEIEMQLNLAVDSEQKVENLAIHDVINWLPLETKNAELFNELVVKNKLLKKFDDGTILKDGEDEPLAICTHFAEEI